MGGFDRLPLVLLGVSNAQDDWLMAPPMSFPINAIERLRHIWSGC